MGSGPSIQFIETQQVRHGGTIDPDAGSHLLMAPAKLITQPAKRGRPIHRVEILALQVLNQCQFGRPGVINGPDDGWDLRPPKTIHSPPPPLTGDEFVRVSFAHKWSNDNRLHQS